MPLKKLPLLSLLVVLTSCNGQEITGTASAPAASGTVPTVIRSSKTIPMAQDFDTSLVSQYFRSIFQDSKGNLWFGTLGEGVVRYDKNTLTYFSHAEGFHTTSVQAINEDKDGNLWFGTDQGVYKYDGKSFRNYNQKDGLSQLNIGRKSILVDKSGSIWVGTEGGVFRYDAAADNAGSRSFSLFQELPIINCAGIMQDREGNIWFASSDQGVFRYDGKILTQFAEKEGLGNNYAGGMAQDQDGNMWFTMKRGICKYDGTSFTGYTAEDGLGGTEFWGIYMEDSGIIWVTARGSTTRFNPGAPLAEAFTVYTPEDGLNCCVQSMYQDRSGNMWWGTGQGLYRFDGRNFYQVKKAGPW